MPIKYDGAMTVLFVADYERARAFYRDVMGLEYVHGEDGVDAYFKIGADGLMLISESTAEDLLSPADVARGAAVGARSVLVTGVDDVDAAYAELLAKGAESVRAPEDRHWGLRTAHFKDPEGNVWEIHQPI